MGKAIEDMLVKELKAELKKLGLPIKGRKAELAERLREAWPTDDGAGTGPSAVWRSLNFALMLFYQSLIYWPGGW